VPALADRAPDWVAAGTPEPLRSELIAELGADRVLTRALDLVRYASDASPYRLIPKAVVTPRDIEDVRKLFAFACRRQTPVVFRAGGTSLNGQAQTDSILVDIRRHWSRARIEDDGARARVQPGIVLGHVNRLLARHGRKLGPDPASTDIACVGGVIANNSGGMRCGISADSYRTVRAMKFVLANGLVIDTAAPDAEQQFERGAPELASGLKEMREQLRGDRELADRVRRKFEIKNTMGYRLCAFLDGESPLEIFRRLIVGSEGTLAFVAEAVFDTVPLGRHSTIALAVFPDVGAAAEAVGPMVAAGASATELMVAPTLIAAAHNMPGTPERWKTLPPESAALLIEFRADEPAALDDPEAAALEILADRELVDPPRFSRDREEIEMAWHVREGMYGLVAAFKPPGAQLITEDVCVPPARIAEAVNDLRALLSEHGFLPGVAGHASAGNLHFMLTPNFAEENELERYDAFINDLVAVIISKYDGSLKAEHGTGMNMAPFVEREWGAVATELMWRIKQRADPDGILGPGIVLNRDPGVHLRHLKSSPEIEEAVTKCIECGFCEPVCPSRNVTTTPRQRIVVRRELARQAVGSPVQRALLEQYEYDGVETCAVDGSCMHACPVAIDTGKLIKDLRRAQHGARAERAGVEAARRYGALERAARGGLRVGGPAVRAWRPSIPPAAPAQLPFTVREGAAAVYMPACINRMFGNDRDVARHPTVPEALVALSARAGLPLWIPPDVAGHCCGTPWSSKGYAQGHELIASRMRAALQRWSEGGRLPVVIDASSCTHGVLAEVIPEGVEVLDSIAWVHDRLLERLELRRKLSNVAVHPTCASRHLGLSGKLVSIASRMADDVVVPAATGCCGMAGDRGWLHPELPASALRDTARELLGQRFDACVSSNRTCEAALRAVTGQPYASFVFALEELTRG
jgi:D-lactate dehydrogenase